MSWPTRFREILKRTELPALVLSVRSVEVGLTTSSYSVASHLNVGNVSGLEGSSLRVSSGSLDDDAVVVVEGGRVQLQRRGGCL